MLAEQMTIDEYMETRKEHTEVLHLKSKGWITIASIQEGKYSQYHYRYKDLLKAVGDSNCYISMNTFFKPQRRIETVKELKHLYIDLDCYGKGYTKAAVLYELEKEFFNKKIPMPNLIIDSGRGIYLIWTIEIVPKMALPLWKAIENYLYKILKEFGADPKALDPTRVLRIGGTLNTKSNTMVQMLDRYEYVYSLREIQKEYLPEIPEKPQKAKGRPNKVVSLFNKYSLHHARFEDLITICELREYDVKGMREHILFLYRYWTCCFVSDPREALRMTLELNEEFRQPLGANEVERATQSAERAYLSKDKEYNYKNTTLIELLEISEEEQKKLKTIIGTKEKYRRKNEKRTPRNEEGLTDKQKELKELKAKVMELRDKGMTIRTIGETLKLSKTKVGRLLK